MSKFSGQVQGSAQTPASRRGTNDIEVSAQSWDGSVITRLHYDNENRLIVELFIGDGSSFCGQSYFYGTIEELKNKLKG